MACATLKRSWEFDPVHSPGRPNKRPRCTPMCVSPTSSSPPPANSSVTAAPAAKKSFFDAPKMTPDQMAASIRGEIERQKRRRQQFQQNEQNGMGMNMSPLSSSSGEGSNSDSDDMLNIHHQRQLDHHHHLTMRPRKQLFTLKEVERICSRVVKEREDQLREEYDAILSNKLHEQYEMFLRFSRDQIQRHFHTGEPTPSYFS